MQKIVVSVAISYQNSEFGYSFERLYLVGAETVSGCLNALEHSMLYGPDKLLSEYWQEIAYSTRLVKSIGVDSDVALERVEQVLGKFLESTKQNLEIEGIEPQF